MGIGVEGLVALSTTVALTLGSCHEAQPQVTPAATLAAAPSATGSAGAAQPPRIDLSLVPRKVFWGNADHRNVRVSPDGRRIGWLAPVGSVMNVWIAPAHDLASGKPVTHETRRSLHGFEWAATSDHLLFTKDDDGDEKKHVYVLALTSGETTDLTAVPGVDAEITATSDHDRRHIVVRMNDRDPKEHDLYLVDIVTGTRSLLLKNPGGFTWFSFDRDMHVRIGCHPDAQGVLDFRIADGAGWRSLLKVPFEDRNGTDVVDFADRGATLLLEDSRGRDTSGLFDVDVKTGRQSLIADDPRADIGEVLTSPMDGHVEAVSVTYERKEWRLLDASLEPDFRALRALSDGDLTIVSRSRDEARWVVNFDVSDGPGSYYLYERAAARGTGEATFLFSVRKALEGRTFPKMRPVVIPSRDGLGLVSYLVVPPGATGPVPMVIFVHGGPWDTRVEWGWNSLDQWLASRGYATLGVNFRGSAGFGKKFLNAGIGEWGGKMQDDLLDAVKWAIDQGVADPARIAITGPSYGGYATLMGLARTPDVYACGIDNYGVVDLVSRGEAFGTKATAEADAFARDMGGDHRTDEGRRFLLAHSPITYAAAITKPLLVSQGAHDPRVLQADSDRLVAALRARGLPVTYLVYPDEGHGFARAENLASLFAVSEAFLAQCLGGAYEPIGDDLSGSSVTVPVGAEQVVGLQDALIRK